MNGAEFDYLLKVILDRTTKVLKSKSDEYSTDADKLHNFKRAGAMLQCTPEKALVGMWTKHIISILDIVNMIEQHKIYPSKQLLAEKCGDSINYIILLEVIIRENIDENVPTL